MRPREEWNEKQVEVDRWLEALGHPERGPVFFYVVGTNGKGSVGRALAQALSEITQTTVGHFLSPHIHRYNERMMRGDRAISDQALEAVQKKLAQVEKQEGLPALPYFIHSFVEAMEAFRDLPFVVIEAGIGAREDATNILPFDFVVLTSISKDHTNILGKTLSEIAYQKASAILPGQCFVSSNQVTEVEAVIRSMAQERLSEPLFFDPAQVSIAQVHLPGAGYQVDFDRADLFSKEAVEEGLAPGAEDWLMTFHYEGSWLSGDYEVPMVGRYQMQNMGTALLALEVLLDGENSPSERLRPYLTAQSQDQRRAAVHRALAKCFLPGRLELVSYRPMILIDGAHNDGAVDLLLENLHWLGFTKQGPYGAPALIYGTHLHKISEAKRDALFREVDATYPVEVEEVPDEARYAAVVAAIDQALKDGPHRPLLIAGSLYLLEGASRYLARRTQA